MAAQAEGPRPVTRGGNPDKARQRAERRAARSAQRLTGNAHAAQDSRTEGRDDRKPEERRPSGPQQAEGRRGSEGAALGDRDRPTQDAVLNAADTDGSVGRIDLIRAAHLFEQMIDMVEIRSVPAPALPGEALSSLLRQCEAISAGAGKAEVPLLIALPGLPMLHPVWWQGAVRWDVVRLPDTAAAGGPLLQPDQLEAMRTARARSGQRLLMVAAADAVPAELPDRLRPRALLTCHPWLAFVAAGTGCLDAFSARLLDFLERHPDLPLYPVHAGDPADRAACRKRLLHLAESAAEAIPPDRTEAGAGLPNDYLGGAPAYEALCRRLGHDPMRVPGTAMMTAPLSAQPELTGWTLPPDGASVAAVSWFLDRLAALPAGASMAARMRALIPSLDACLSAPAFPEALDRAAGLLRPGDAALLRLLAAAHFQRREDALQSMGLVAEALEDTPDDLPMLHQAGALLYLELNRPLQALEALAAPLAALDEATASALRKAIHKDAPPDAGQHGQALLLAELAQNPPLPLADGRRRIMIEIGTTRETVPGQGSTRQLALLCAELGIDFVTVDMDPANSRRAARMFRRLGLPFTAVTAKGEDYLASFEGRIDYVFLDAYDFDHGKHSELRQARYEQFLGSRINDADCHRMHLDCARTLAEKLSPDGLICFDDTWTDEAGAWTAKGKTAMPFLLENGFALVEARNRAALLRPKG